MRFYEELNDFLPPEKRKVSFDVALNGQPSVKDVIESLAVPHTEVDLIIVNRESVGFDYQVQAGDNISVYPVFEALDISPINHLRPKPLRELKFILDVHLGKLAKRLRLLGFDSLYTNNYEDQQIIDLALEQQRIILTRDIGILKNGRVTHGYWLRQTDPKLQIYEILQRFDMCPCLQPFTRCIECNGLIHPVDKQQIEDALPEKTAEYYQEYFQCDVCKKIYWQGSHYQHMLDLIDEIKYYCSQKRVPT